MRDFPSCFGENGVQVADSSSSSSSTSKAAQNLVTCVYHCNSQDRCFVVSVSWFKSMMGQGLSVAIDDSANQGLCKVDIKPWLFSKRKGFKNLEVESDKIGIFWDLSNARFGSGPDPLEAFYLAVALNQRILLLLGDMKKEAYKKTGISPADCPNAIFVAKREHVFGKKVYGARVQFHEDGGTHELVIECDTVDVRDPCLVIRVDGKPLMQIKRLKWKFRGNQTILVDGLPVEVCWDVHNWLFGNVTGNAVFMFQTCLSTEKLRGSRSAFDPAVVSWSCSQKLRDLHRSQALGFCLILYAWKSE